MNDSVVTINRGDSWERAWIIKDASGNYVDLSGATVRLQVRDLNDNLKAEANVSNGQLTITPGVGRIDLLMPYTVTQTFDPGTYFFDLEVTFPTGIRKTYERGKLIVEKDYTHD